jgi:hypothetical protein
LFLHVNPNGTRTTSNPLPVCAQDLSSKHAQLRVSYNLADCRPSSRTQCFHPTRHSLSPLPDRYHSRSIPTHRPLEHLLHRLHRGPSTAWTYERVRCSGFTLIIDLESIAHYSASECPEIIRLQLVILQYPDDLVVTLQSVGQF